MRIGYRARPSLSRTRVTAYGAAGVVVALLRAEWRLAR
jgi:hypothetical protein